jgi:hypothetical protein
VKVRDRTAGSGKDTEQPSGREQPSASLQAVLDALEDFVAVETWTEARRVVETHREQLLSDVVDDVLTTLIARYQNPEAVKLLTQYRRVLVRCRVEGIDAAFAELAPEDDDCPSWISYEVWQRIQHADSYAKVMELITEHPDLTPFVHRHIAQTLEQEQRVLLSAMDALLTATSYAETRAVITRHQVLLDLDADIWLDQYTKFLKQRGETDAATLVTARRWMLAGCRIIGVDATLSPRLPAWDGLQVEVGFDVLQWMMTEPAQTA